MRDATPFRLLGLWDNGFRHLTNRVRPIRTPADCRGLRIRTQMSELHGEALRALGFVPIPVDVKEGDTVIYSKYGGTEIKYAGQEYLILSARDELAVISK